MRLSSIVVKVKCIKNIFLPFFFCLLFHSISAQSKQSYSPLSSDNIIQDKNFYLFTLIEKVPAVWAAILEQPVIAAIYKRKLNEIKNIECKVSPICIAQSFIWKQQEIDSVGMALSILAKKNLVIQAMINKHMRPSGYFIIYDKSDNASLLETAWKEAMRGINHIIEVYGMGKAPLYPAIDSVSYDVRSERYGRLLTIVYQKDTQAILTKTFFIPALQFALDLLLINNRDEAARFEPMNQSENKAAIDYIHSINWAKYPFSLIVVPGAGNDLPNVPLAAWGKLRLELAVQRYKNGEAPIIAVSGGYVHPFQTPYCEALEMKRYLKNHYHIPEKAIMIDPHARHTTTNIRNVNRMIYEYGMPFSKEILIITDPNQSAYIESTVFYERCKNELKILPFSSLKRISSFDLSYLPQMQVLYRNSMDPLDP